MAKKWYVYKLADPKDGSIFYVGKGCGSRMYHHGRPKDTANPAKLREIARIGRERVLRRKVAHFDVESDALCYEAKLVSHLERLTNVAKTGERNKKPETFFSGLFNFVQMTTGLKRGSKTESVVVSEAKRLVEKWWPLSLTEDESLHGHRLLLDIPKRFLESRGYRIKYEACDA